jgi:hypothetical protein
VCTSLAFDDKASGVCHVAGFWMFGDALAGDCRGVDGKRCDAVQRRICGYPLALRQQYHVANDELVGGDLLRHTVA